MASYVGRKQKKRILHKFTMKEVSSVDRPAQQPALALLMKNQDPEQFAKLMFDQALAELELGEEVHEFIEDMWTLNEALRRSIREIVEDKETYPDPISAARESLAQFASAVQTMVDKASEDFDVSKAETKTESGKSFPASDYAYVPDSNSPSTWKLRLTSAPGGDPDPSIVGAAAAALGPGFRGRKVQIPQADRAAVVAKVRKAWLKANPDKDSEDLPAVLKKMEDSPMPADNTPTVEELQKKFDAQAQELEIAKAFGSLSDAEKSHYSKLDEGEQAAFLKMDSETRGALIKKSQENDPVVYTSMAGDEFRKSDDRRLVAAIRNADEFQKRSIEAEARAKTLELRKRANEEYKHLPGNEDARVELLRKVDSIEDEEIRESVNKMLRAQDAGLGAAFAREGVRGEAVTDAESELNKLAKAYAEEHKVDFTKAYATVLDTPRGSELYEQTLSQ